MTEGAIAVGAAAETNLARIGCDPDAFEVFYRAHVEEVERFIARRVGDPYTVADLTADVFLAAIESAGSYRPGRGAVVAWLFGIARHVVASHHRRKARESRALSEVSGSALVEHDDLVRLEERIDATRQARALYLAMNRLTDAERAVLELVALDGLSVADAARALQVTAVAARVRLHRARNAMRRELAPPVTEKLVDLSEAQS